MIPDTVSNGQTGITGMMIFENTGSAQLSVTEAQLSFLPPADFLSILSGRTTPFTVSGNTIDTLNFAVTAATSLTGDVSVDGILSGFDINSNAVSSDTSQTSLFLQSEAAPAWAGSTEPSSAELDSSVVFKVTVVNTGESSIQIDTTQTTLVLESSPALVFTFSDTSDLVVDGNGDTTILVFKESVITGIPADDYSLTLNLIGTSNSSSYSSTFNVGTITVGGQIFFGPAQVTPNQVIQGERNLVAIMQIGNNGVPLTIDSLGTTLIFRDEFSNTLFVDSLTRTDTLTVLRSISDNELTFSFNVPADFELGVIDVFGKISLDNNSIEKESLNPITNFTVTSGANVLYVDNSLAPTQVVPNEDVLFSVALFDSGTADLALIPDSTYLQIGFTPALRTNLGGNYNLSANDTTAVTFESIQIPGSISNGTYGLMLHTVGTTFGRDTLTQDIALSDSLTILSSGALVLSSIQLSDTVVSQGSSDETLSLGVLNTGEAPAQIFSADSIQFSYNSSYSLSLNSGQIFPLTIDGSDSALFVYNVFVDPSAVAGQDTFRATIGYEDVNSGVSYTASDPGVYDNWLVLSDVSLTIVSLTATDTRVTQGQSGLAVSLEISNTGETGAVVGSADSIGITFLANNNTVTLVSPALPDTILPDTSRIYNFTVDINPSAATGIDSLAGFVIGRNVRTGSVSSISNGYLDGWDVQTPANIVLTSVFNSLSQIFRF
jgi:hypothetical protein